VKPEFIDIGNYVINVAAIHSYWRSDDRCFGMRQMPIERKDNRGFLVNHYIKIECFSNDKQCKDIRTIEVRSLEEREEIMNKLDKILNVTKIIEK